MIATPPPIPPPFYEVKNYRLGSKKRIEMLCYVPWQGINRKKAHPGAKMRLFIGFAVIHGLRADGQKFPKKITFSIPACTIHQAIVEFDECAAAAIADLNKPEILLPPGIEG